MSIDRQHGKIIFECDTCPNTFEGETDDFNEEWLVAKRSEGWTVRKVVGEWMHFCPRCSQAGKNR